MIFDNDVLHPKLTLVRVLLRNAVQFGVVQSTAEETNVRPTDPSKSLSSPQRTHMGPSALRLYGLEPLLIRF